MKTSLIARAAMLVAALAAGTAHAVPVVAGTNVFASGGTVVTFNDFDGLLTTGPLEVAPGVTFTSSPFTTVGADAQDLGDNGLWGARGTPADGLVDTPTGNGHFLASAFVARRGEFGFSFAAPVAKVGAFFNQYQLPGNTANSLGVVAYDQQGNVLETFTYRVDTDAFGYNEGSFLGFQRAQADIWGFGVTDGSFVMDNLTTAPVPEPGSLGLLLAGLAGLAACARRRT